MKFKSGLQMAMILLGLLSLILTGALLQNQKAEPDNSEVIEWVVPDTFAGTIDDQFDVDQNAIRVIRSYMDAYFRSIYTLEEQDLTEYFSDERMKEVSEKAIRLLIESRKLYNDDFRLDAAHYDLQVTDYRKEGNEYHVEFLEDDYMKFMFLNGIESSAYDIENYFVLELKDGDFRIKKLEKIQGYYLDFYDEYASGQDLNIVYDYYFSQLRDLISYNNDVLKIRAQDQPYVPAKTVKKTYDRNKATAYADLYYTRRNPEWYNFTDEGGNCQNYASQCILEGGIPMDYEGEEQWKCYIEDPEYDPEINEEESDWGRTKSWVSVTHFYNYARENNGKGLVAETNINIFYGEPGDLVLVGNGSLAHTVIISKVVDGHILVHSNSIDMKNYPLEAYTYNNVQLVKILGSN